MGTIKFKPGDIICPNERPDKLFQVISVRKGKKSESAGVQFSNSLGRVSSGPLPTTVLKVALLKKEVEKPAKDIAVIIPAYGNSYLLKTCLEYLRKGFHGRVVIVNDGSDESLLEIAQEYSCDYLENEVNSGFAASINKGITSISADAYVLLNTDCFVGPATIPQMIKCMNETKAGIVGAKLLFPDGNIQHAGIVSSHNWIHRGQGEKKSSFSQREFVWGVTFALALIHSEVIKKIGLLDERFFISCEDVVFCDKAIRAGFRICYEPKAIATHLEGATRGNKPYNKNPYWYKKELEARELFEETRNER